MTAPDSRNLFWDSCVVVRWLTEHPTECVDHIEQFLHEASRGERKIHISTVLFTEVRPRYLKNKKYGTMNDLIKDFKSAFVPIDPTPDIMQHAGALRDIEFKKSGGGPRNVGTGDAIQLMTAVYARDELGISDLVFHTFDEGKGKTWEGKCVPLLGFETWCDGYRSHPLVKAIIDLPRHKPEHPNPKML